MESLISQIRDLYKNSDEDGRRKIETDVRDLQQSLDSDWDMVMRIGAGPLQLSLVKIGVDLNIFRMLSLDAEPLSLDHLIQKTSAAPKLLSHLVRAMASLGFIRETAVNTYTANRLTHAFANEHIAGALDHGFDVHSPVAYVLPSWLKERGYRDITSNKDLPFQTAMKTDLTPFEWMKQHPEQMKSLGHAMAIQRDDHWIDSFPVSTEVGDFVPADDSALLVDIGGGFGQQALAFKKKFADLKGRVVVQDIPTTLASAPKTNEIEFQSQDFFVQQPIKKAKFYYLRHILHDWSDEESVRILKAVVPAMGQESRIVIDEVVLPDEKLPWQAAYMDLTMMASLGGVERTKAEYQDLLDAAGLQILCLHKYDSRKMQSVIIAAPK